MQSATCLAAVTDPDPDADANSVAEWRDFLAGYGRGEFDATTPPAQPLSPRGSHSTEPLYAPIDPNQLYPSTHIDDDTARTVRDHTLHAGFMPPPRSPYEDLRTQCITAYELEGDEQRANVQRALDLVSAFFPGALCTFTLFRGRAQNFISIAGPQNICDQFNLQNDMDVRPDLSLCGHCVLLDERQGDAIMFIPELSKDWRTQGNPYTTGGIQSYVGCAISLELDRLREHDEHEILPRRIGIGALNVLFVDTPLLELEPQQRVVLNSVTHMLETQLRATWDGNRQSKEARYRSAVTRLIEQAFVGEVEGGTLPGQGVVLDFEHLASLGMSQLVEIIPVLKVCSIVDLRCLQLKEYSQRPHYVVNSNSQYLLPRDDGGEPGSCIIAQSRADPSSPQVPQPSPTSIGKFMNAARPHFTFDARRTSGLEPELPPNTHSHLCMPFTTPDQPSFAIIATSSEPDVDVAFNASSVAVVRSIGAVLLARATQTRVEEADAAKTIFLSSISHELRTPLHSIMAALHVTDELIAERDWESLVPVMADIRQSGRALRATLNDVLDFGRAPDNASAQLHEEDVELLDRVRSAARMALSQAESLGSQFKLDLEYERRDWFVTLDAAKFQRIVVNGLTNALKFSPNAPVTVRLSARLYKDSSPNVVLCIADQGPGIDPAHIPHLLEPFSKQDKHTAGLGLGLHISKTLAETLGGELWLESEPGVGTTYTAVIPIKLTAAAAAEADVVVETIYSGTHGRPPSVASLAMTDDYGFATPRSRSPALMPRRVYGVDAARSSPPPPTAAMSGMSLKDGDAAPPRSGLRVMVVDDNSVCRRLLGMTMKRSAHKPRVEQYANGKEAADAFPTFRPHLVLTDVSMPVMDGVEAARHMRAHEDESDEGYRCSIFALTGLGASDPRAQASGMMGDAALDGWLTKGQDDMRRATDILDEVARRMSAREERVVEEI